MKTIAFLLLMMISISSFSQITIEKKPIEAMQFTGDNYDKLKAWCPQLEKYTFRSKKDAERGALEHFKLTERKPASPPKFSGYTVGWKTFGENFTEALPGFWIVKEDGIYTILPPDQFEKTYQ
jgi:hypothetical protein